MPSNQFKSLGDESKGLFHCIQFKDYAYTYYINTKIKFIFSIYFLIYF